MRVDDRNVANNAALGQLAESQQVRRGAGSAGRATENRPEDQVEISDLSSRIGQEMGRVEDQRAERVAQLAAAYRAGQYQVDSRAASHAMVNESLASSQSE